MYGSLFLSLTYVSLFVTTQVKLFTSLLETYKDAAWLSSAIRQKPIKGSAKHGNLRTGNDAAHHRDIAGDALRQRWMRYKAYTSSILSMKLSRNTEILNTCRAMFAR